MLKILCCLAITSSLFSEIRTIYSLAEVPIDNFSQATLVMLDLDDVLIYPKDVLMQHWRGNWKPEGVRAWTAEEDTIAWMNAHFQILDPFGPKLIDALNEQGIPTIGFTSFAMDQAGIVESIPKWRSQHLKALGLHFKEEQEVVFAVQEKCIQPSFEKGVLYCGDLYKKEKDNKAKILALYLNWLHWTPQQVILIDDGKKHLESVQEELEQRAIPFIGFHYIPKDLEPIDTQVAELQYHTIIHQKRWLSDQEAKKLLSEDQ
jgi:hypothetical protein